jgi:hypothetical protein
MKEAAMQAEIFFLRLETRMRGLEEASRPRNPRFVPFSPETYSPLRDKQAGESRKHE